MCADRCFSNPTESNSSSDYTRSTKQKTIFKDVVNQVQGQTNFIKSNGVNYNENFGLHNNCLAFAKSYDLLLDVTKGKYYTTPVEDTNWVSNEAWSAGLYSVDYSANNVKTVVDTSYNAGNGNHIIFPMTQSAELADLSWNGLYPGVVVDPSYTIFYNECDNENYWREKLVDMSFNNTNYYKQSKKQSEKLYGMYYPANISFDICLCGIINIDISTIAINTGENIWTIVENKTIEKCEILTINNGITLTMNNRIILTVNGRINNNGTIQTNGGEIINNVGATINNDNGTINIIGGYILNSGLITNTNNSTIICSTRSRIFFNISNTGYGTIINTNNSIINNTARGNILNAGILINTINSTIINTLNSRIVNTGQLNNENGCEIRSIVESIFTNTDGGIFNNNGGTFIQETISTVISGTFTNDSIVNNNSGTIRLLNSMFNNGTLNNNNGTIILYSYTFSESPFIFILGTISNTGIINNLNNSTITTSYSYSLWSIINFPDGIIKNGNSTITIVTLSTILNNGTIYNFEDGFINNLGTITNTGEINNADGTSTCGTGIIVGFTATGNLCP